jgi:thiol:disulfide interchange protein DsbG
MKKYLTFCQTKVLPALLALCLLGALTAPAFAEDPKNLRNPEIQKFERDGGRVDYLGTAYGLDGWIMFDSKGEFRSVVYSTPDGGMIRGALFGSDGKSVTKLQMEAYNARKKGSQAALPNSDNLDSGLPKAEYFYGALEKSNWVRVGKDDAPYLYLLINVNCVHCQEMWKSFQPAIQSGKLQVRLLPFGKIEKNLNGGAALLSVDKPGAAWQSYIDGHEDALSVGKIATGALEKMKANNAFVDKWKPKGTPFTIYRSLANGKLVAIVGKPENTMLVLADLMKTN